MSLTVFVRERTDPGLVRKQNQDFHGYHKPPRGSPLYEAKGELYIVADGMGGGAAGDLAGQWSVQKVIYEYYNDPDPTHDPAASLRRAIEEANYELYVNATTDPSRKDMGSTIVAAVIWGNLLIVANVGDSRAYLIRNGQILRLTEDHSWVAEAVKKGILTPEEAANHPNRNVLTRNLGGRPDVEVDIRNYALQPGDTVILCTDGLHGVVSDAEIAQIASQPDLSRAPSYLIALANERGGPDNITVTLLHLCDEEEARRLKRQSDTQPVEPVPPAPLDDFLQERPAPHPGLLEEFAEFFRTYPTLSAIVLAVALGLVALALLLVLLSRGGGEEGRGTLSTPAQATQPTISPPPVSASTPLPSPTPPITPSYGYLAYIISPQDYLLCVAKVEKGEKGPYLMTATACFTTTPPTASHPTWLPDGEHIIFQATKDQDRAGDFYIVSWDGQRLGVPQPLGDEKRQTLKGRYPAVSPDGKYLAYTVEDGEIWTCELSGQANRWECKTPKKITDPCPSVSKEQGPASCEDRYPAWSPDGKEIFFTRTNKDSILNCDPSADLWKVVLDDKKEPVLLFSDNVVSAYPALSPNGEWLALTTCQQYSRLNLAVTKVPTTTVSLTPSPWEKTGVEPAWSPDGEWIVFAYIPGGGNPWQLHFISADRKLRSCANGSKWEECTFYGREPAWWWPKGGLEEKK